MTNLGATIGNSIKKLRGNTSQSDFAETFGVGLRTYQRYESGERIFPDEILDKILKKYHLEINDLFGEREKVKKTLKPSQMFRMMASLPDEVYELASELDDPGDEVWHEIAETLEIAIQQKHVNGSNGA